MLVLKPDFRFHIVLQTTFEVPAVETLRLRVLSSVARKWRDFKSFLTSRYIFGKLQGVSPCSKYPSLDEETWKRFVALRESSEWKVIWKT